MGWKCDKKATEIIQGRGNKYLEQNQGAGVGRKLKGRKDRARGLMIWRSRENGRTSDGRDQGFPPK